MFKQFFQAEALDLVTAFPGARRIPGPAQVEALLRVDARLEPVIVQLTQQYTTNYMIGPPRVRAAVSGGTATERRMKS